MACAAEKITADADKFRRAFLALDTKTAELVASIDPASSDSFKQLCDTLLAAHAPSDGSQLANLLAATSLEDLTPSAYARKIQRSLPKDTPDCIVRQIFLRALPHDVRLPIAAIQDADITKLATIADTLIKHTEPTSAAAVRTPASTNSTEPEQIESTEQRNTQPPPRTTFYPRRRPQFRRTQQQNQTRGFCIYHFRWGNQARQCRNPCSWPQARQQRSTPQQGNANAQSKRW